MKAQDDWRLQGQEEFLTGVRLYHRKYRHYARNPNWDHDHCSFCWAEFMIESQPDVLHQGYSTADDYYWVCEKCFEDFKELFRWEVVEELDVRE